MTPESQEIWSEFELLRNLQRMNKGMGVATQRLLEHQSVHGMLPPLQLREMAVIFQGTAVMLVRFADRLEGSMK